MIKVAILDDWQDVARSSADWSPLASRAGLTFFADAFDTEDAAAAALADFDILLTMRERTAFPETLLRRLPKLRMIGITGAYVATLDIAACSRQGIVVCNTAGRGVTHSERTSAASRKGPHSLFGIQTWVALPEAQEDAEPTFEHHGKDRSRSSRVTARGSG